MSKILAQAALSEFHQGHQSTCNLLSWWYFNKSIVNFRKPPYSTTVQGTPFLHRHWFGNIADESHELSIWASYFSLSILRTNKAIFIDTIFRMIAMPFFQCHIGMVHDLTTNIYVPTVWILMTCKNEYLYFYV
ncbi:hypothetical protein MXB_3950 [Myxobolus squamalis]|nr:hypothetical protein MXB_3950 [Myxobolus squamalis]